MQPTSGAASQGDERDRTPPPGPGFEQTRRLHQLFAMLEASALGVLANAPVVAMRTLGSPTWQLALVLVPSSLGILLDLYLGARMASRRKVPYIRCATIGVALAVFGMAMASSPLLFNLLHGAAFLGQVVTQMALASVVRGAYPVERRGAIAGRIRSLGALAFFTTALGTAVALDRVAGIEGELLVARSLLAAAGVASLASSFVVARIRAGDLSWPDVAPVHGLAQAFASAWRIVREDHRFRLYLAAATLAAIGSLMTAPYVNALLVRRLELGYLTTVAVAQLIPQLCAFLTTSAWGRVADRRNVWQLSCWIRAVWGASFVAIGVATLLAATAPQLALVTAAAAKIAFGCVMGGSWLIFWQLGVTHFASPGPDTSRYMSLVAMVSGLGRLVGPGIGALVIVASDSLFLVFTLGGALSLVASVVCHFGYRLERDVPRFRTAAAFEAGAATPPGTANEP